MKFIVTAHPDKSEAQKVKTEIEIWIKNLGNMIVAEDDTSADLVVVLGGDGFLIHNVTKYSPLNIPCLGINAGNVGFLTSGNLNEWKSLLTQVLEKNFKVEERMGLELEYKGEKFGPFANDIYLKHPTLMSSYNVKINSEVIFKNLHGDGIIVSTPTGSTGYNVSAGGPIIQPKVYSLVVTPICPVHLNIRSLVLDPESEIEIEVLHDRHFEPVSLTADGKFLSALAEDKEKIVIRRHPKSLLFVILDHSEFYKALQNKKGLMK